MYVWTYRIEPVQIFHDLFRVGGYERIKKTKSLYINNVIEFSSSTEYAMHDKEQDWKHKTKQQNDQMKAPKGEVCITMLA